MSARSELCGDTEDCVDELALRYWIALSDPADLTLRMACIALYPSIVRTCTLIPIGIQGSP